MNNGTLNKEVISEPVYPDGWVLDEYREDPPVEAQTELKGKWFNRDAGRDHVLKAGEEVYLTQSRKVRIIAGINSATGMNVFEPVDITPVDPTEFPHLPLKNARLDESGIVYDSAFDEPPSLETVRSHGASRSGVDVEQQLLDRGAEPGFKMDRSQMRGWNFGAPPSTFVKRK